MNLLTDKESAAKIAEPPSNNNGKKYFTPIRGRQRVEAMERKGQFSLFYGQTLDEKNISYTAEAEALGVSVATVSQYKSVTEERNLPAALIPMSKVGNEIMQSLAAEMGGTFLAHEGAHESKRPALSRALSILSVIADDECGRSDEIMEWKLLAEVCEKRLDGLR